MSDPSDVNDLDLARAKKITAACVRNRTSLVSDQYVPLPECSLANMLAANEIVRLHGCETSADGGTTLYVHCDPRALAASYAFEQYGRDPVALLEAVGFEATEENEDE